MIRAAAVIAALLLALVGCKREARRLDGSAPGEASIDKPVRMSVLQPGNTAAGEETTHGPYEGEAHAISEGQKLYARMNCVGCHANGGGGIGPPLMDDFWQYGGEPAQVYQTIMEGRPNGMPSFGGKIPSRQVWQLTAFVRSMSGKQPMDAISARTDHMQPYTVTPPR
jgi:cytochrome c oxidase cbb3-type subunit 3